MDNKINNEFKEITRSRIKVRNSQIPKINVTKSIFNQRVGTSVGIGFVGPYG